jgi:enoyl-CoA hydratase/carnithine racemase
MVTELASVLRTWNQSDSARAIVLKGGSIESGKRSFCAGGDVVRNELAFFVFILTFIFFFCFRID